MKRLLAQFILITDTDNVHWGDRIKYIWNIFIHVAPVAFTMDVINWWFSENEQFGTFMCASLIVNMVVGAIMHLYNKTFSFKLFIFKNMEMGFVVVVVYVMLEMLRYTAGANFAGEIFRVSIQIMTLLYPTSKVMKNVFILTKGRYPPEFLMKRLYNFEKNGDLGKLFGTEKADPDDNYKVFFEEQKERVEHKKEKETL